MTAKQVWKNGRALSGSVKPWKIYASPEVLNGGPSTAGHKLFEDPSQRKEVQTNLALHLRTSNRSLRADQLATWVNFVIDGKAEEAASLGIPSRFPIFMSRNLVETRSKLRKQGIGASRYGLVGSSGAARLRSEARPSPPFRRNTPGNIGIWLMQAMCAPAFGARFSLQSLRYRAWSWIGSACVGVGILFGIHCWDGRRAVCCLDRRADGRQLRMPKISSVGTRIAFCSLEPGRA